MLVVINKCFGGFGLSAEAGQWLINNKGWKYTTEDNEHTSLLNKTIMAPRQPLFDEDIYFDDSEQQNEFRSHPDIVECVEVLKEKADGRFAKLKIVDIPFDDVVGWNIKEYDGIERIEEEHRSW